MKKPRTRYIDGYREIRRYLRRIGADWENAKKVGAELRDLKRLNPRFDGPEILAAWRAWEEEDWEDIDYWECEGFDFCKY